RLGGIEFKQNYMNIALGFERIVQLLDGTAYRLILIKSHNIEFPRDIYEQFIKFRDILLKQYGYLFEGLRLLAQEPKKSLSKINEVLKLEENADEMYRKFTFTIYKKLGDRVLALMTLRDIIDMIENTIDLLRTMGEELRYLVLQRIAIG
ncbi:MAG: DUF47 family protein, partial [Thermoprotei archaeon]